MYQIEGFKKRDPKPRWALPERGFFACSVCHILAYAFLEKYQGRSFRANWIKPDAGFTGNHIYVASDCSTFDYHGYSESSRYLTHVSSKARRRWPGWGAGQIELP